jgi:hypothetical protein
VLLIRDARDPNTGPRRRVRARSRHERKNDLYRGGLTPPYVLETTGAREESYTLSYNEAPGPSEAGPGPPQS